MWSVISMMKTLFLQAPSFDGFDGGFDMGGFDGF